MMLLSSFAKNESFFSKKKPSPKQNSQIWDYGSFHSLWILFIDFGSQQVFSKSQNPFFHFQILKNWIQIPLLFPKNGKNLQILGAQNYILAKFVKWTESYFSIFSV